MIYKQWKISKVNGLYGIDWRWSDSKGTMFSYNIGRSWKTIKGATAWGLKYFGRNSENNSKI